MAARARERERGRESERQRDTHTHRGGGGGGSLAAAMEADGPSVTLPESVPPTEGAYSEPEPEPSATSEPKPAATSEPQPEPGLPQTPEESLREPPVFQTLRVVVYDVERGSSADSEDVENIDINAPLTEVIAEIEEQLGSDELFAEDIKSITIYNDSERSTPRLTAARDEFVDTSLAELGLTDGMSVGITTFQYAQQMTRRYGAAYGGDRPAAANRPFGDFTEGDGAGDNTQPVALPLELAEPGTVGGKHRVPSTRVYDFRRCTAGVLPQGAAVIDPAAEAATEAKPELEEQNDKSMALVLKKGQFVELDLDPDAPTDPDAPRAKQKPTTGYTITMDLKLEKLPEEYLSLFSPSCDADSVELCQVDKYGGVGNHAQFGVKEAAAKESKWTRVVVTVKLGREQGMTTYVVTKKGVTQCAEIRSNYFVPTDSALVLSKSKMRLFYSANAAHAIGEKPVRLKYVSVKRRHMDKDLIKAHAEKDRIFSYWDAKNDEEDDDEAKKGSLFLHGVRGAKLGDPPRTVPLFVTPPFLCEFATEMLRGSGWTGGDVSMAMPILAKVVEVMLEPEQAPPLFSEIFAGFCFDSAEMQSLNAICKAMRNAAQLSQKFKLAQRGGPQVVQFLKQLRRRTAALQVGESMIVPGASGYPDPREAKKWVTVSLTFVLERTSEEFFRFTVVNTDVEGGLAYHELNATQSVPTIDYKVCMALDDVPKERMLDDAWWLFVLKLVSAENHPASKRLYDLLLPWLTDKPLEESFSAAAEVDFRKPHDNEVSFYRCVTETIFYLLRRQGFSSGRAEQVIFCIRTMMLIQADLDLYHSQMSDREARFLKIAWQNFCSSTAELEEMKLLSVQQLLHARAAVEQMKKHVATRLTWLSWSEQAELNEMHVFASSASLHIEKPTRLLFIASIADGGHEGIADSLMKEFAEVEKVMSASGGALQPALPSGLFFAIGKYDVVQTKLKQCAATSSDGPLVLHFSSHGNDDDQSVRFEGNNDIEAFAKDIAAAKPAVVILSACLTLPLALAIWEASDPSTKPTIVSWAKPVGTVVAEIFSKTFYAMISEAAGTGKVVLKDAEDIDATDPLAVRQMLHRVAAHKKLSKQVTAVDEPEAAATRETPTSNRSDGPPPPLQLNAEETNQSSPTLTPFFDTLPRKDDVDGLAGTAADVSTYVPVNFLSLPEKVSNAVQALECIRVCEGLCGLIHSQKAIVKNSALLRACLIEHVFVHLVPVPQPPDSQQECIWGQPLSYSQQLDMIILLQRVMEHFASAALSLHPTKSFDAVRIVVVACITALADSVLRRQASDNPSAVSTHLMGQSVHGDTLHAPYGIDASLFAKQSETCEVHTPELNIARCGVLDYFAAQQNTEKIFTWEKGKKIQKSTNEFLLAIAKDQVHGVKAAQAHRLLDNEGYSVDRNFGGGSWQLHKTHPEFAPYRDVCFYFKYFLNPDSDAFPTPSLHAYRPNEAALHWSWDEQEGQYIIGAKWDSRFPYDSPKELFQMSCLPRPVKPKHSSTKGAVAKVPKHRYPSGADVTLIVDDFVNQGEETPISINVKTEDDILHLRNLPTFDDSLTAGDSELLLSFLTEPYLRVPLVLSFFATEDRIHSLKQPKLRELLDAVLWEPGQFSSPEVSKQVPQAVPAEKQEQLATAYGLMLNELYHSPSVVLQATVKLMKLALDLNTGTPHGSTSEVILFVCRLAARMDSYVSFVIDLSEGNHPSLSRKLRDVHTTAETVAELKSGLEQIRALLHGDLLTMIKDFSVMAYREYKDSVNEETLNVNSQIICCLHAHLILAHRNVPLSEHNANTVKCVMASFVATPLNDSLAH